jgi:hypothetical protein
MQVPKHRPAVGEKAYPVHSVTLDELLASRSAEMRRIDARMRDADGP